MKLVPTLFVLLAVLCGCAAQTPTYNPVYTEVVTPDPWLSRDLPPPSPVTKSGMIREDEEWLAEGNAALADIDKQMVKRKEIDFQKKLLFGKKYQ
jgi:hypothetical protein